MDFIEAMVELSSHFDGTWWSIDGLCKDPDLTGFKKQDTGYPLFPVEYIYQDGNGDYGFAGVSLFPTGRCDGEFLKVSFSLE